MTTLHAVFPARLGLTASTSDRVIRGVLLPYGEQGSTNLGTITASAGSLTLPDDPTTLLLNIEHEHTRRVGRAVTIDETDDGLTAAFTIARTTAGDDALTEATEGLRACLSIEVTDPVIRGGQLTAGTVTGAALVAEPAFPGARLTAAEDTDPTPDPDPEAEPEADAEDEDTPTTEPTGPDTADDEPPAGTTTNQENPMTVTVPRTGAAPTGKLTASKTSATSLYTMLAKAASGDRTMLAALADVVPANILGIEQPQYVGELWDGKAYTRQFIPSWNHADLTSYEVTGWRWVTRPAVAAWEGNKTNVPSNPIATEQVKIAAQRIAGAHDIDRKFRDFNDTEFFAAYFAAMTESYAKVSDATALADVVAAATPVTAGTVPTGVASGLVQVVDGILAILNATDTMPDTAFMATNLYRDVILTRQNDILGYLNAALGLEEGTIRNFRIVPTAQIAAGKTLVSCHDAATVHELGGDAPIRVEALDVARGGLDEGVFGYVAVNIHDAGGLALVSAGA